MAEKHPNELELLSFVEEELDADARGDVAEHLVACRACTDQVRRLEAASAALREAPLLELPDERRDEILRALPERSDPWRLFRPVKRALVTAAPVAAAAALVAVFVVGAIQLGGGGDDDDSGEAVEVAEDAGGGADATRSAELEEAAPAVTSAAPVGTTFVLSTLGPPADIVRLLGDAGIEAEVEPGGGVIADARAGEVREALTGRATGGVPVYVR